MKSCCGFWDRFTLCRLVPSCPHHCNSATVVRQDETGSNWQARGLRGIYILYCICICMCLSRCHHLEQSTGGSGTMEISVHTGLPPSPLHQSVFWSLPHLCTLFQKVLTARHGLPGSLRIHKLARVALNKTCGQRDRLGCITYTRYP